MTDQLPRSSGEHRHSPLFVPIVPVPVHRRGWFRRRSPSTVIAAVLLIFAIGASLVYAYRNEASHEAAAASSPH
ncbi:MAG: hypothetical protein ABJE47_00170 [bacterium]